MSAALLARLGYDYDLRFVGGPLVYKVYTPVLTQHEDEDESFVGKVTINSETVKFSGFSFESDGVARWTHTLSTLDAPDVGVIDAIVGPARAVVAITSALNAGYSFKNAVLEFGGGFLVPSGEARRNPRSNGYVARKIAAHTQAKNNPSRSHAERATDYDLPRKTRKEQAQRFVTSQRRGGIVARDMQKMDSRNEILSLIMLAGDISEETHLRGVAQDFLQSYEAFRHSGEVPYRAAELAQATFYARQSNDTSDPYAPINGA